MKLNLEESEKKKYLEKQKNMETKLNDKEILDKEVRNHIMQQKINRINKIKQFVDGIKLNEMHKETEKMKDKNLSFIENERIQNEVTNIFRREDEAEKERITNQNKLKETVQFTLQNQLIEKKLRIKSDKEINSKIDKDYLRNLNEIKFIDKEKEIRNRINMNKYKEELDKQCLKKEKNKLNEMSILERRLNRQLIEEMINYNSPLNYSIELLK